MRVSLLREETQEKEVLGKPGKQVMSSRRTGRDKCQGAAANATLSLPFPSTLSSLSGESLTGTFPFPERQRGRMPPRLSGSQRNVTSTSGQSRGKGGVFSQTNVFPVLRPGERTAPPGSMKESSGRSAPRALNYVLLTCNNTIWKHFPYYGSIPGAGLHSRHLHITRRMIFLLSRLPFHT